MTDRRKSPEEFTRDLGRVTLSTENWNSPFMPETSARKVLPWPVKCWACSATPWRIDQVPPGLTTDVRPITLTSRLERLPGLGAQILAEDHVITVDDLPEALATIRFSLVGTKHLSLAWAPLKAV